MVKAARDPAGRAPAAGRTAAAGRAAAAGRTAADPGRRSRLAKIHLARKRLAMTEDSYRDMLQRLTRRRSAAELTIPQLDLVLIEFRRLGFTDDRDGRGGSAGGTGSAGGERASKPAPARAKAPGGQLAASAWAAKMRALWLSGWHLGVVEDPSEAALVAFARRQTHVDLIQWVGPGQATAVIEAIKGWLTREAGVDWSSYHASVGGKRVTYEDPRQRVIEAQWRLLRAMGAAEAPTPRPPEPESAEAADALIRALGERIRQGRETGAEG